ncbi:MAG: hypothetical protein AAF492_13215, partial [Verrucomicrobiota bacterium]
MTEHQMKTELNAQLAVMEERWKKIRFWRAAGNTFILFLTALALGAVIDYFMPLTIGQRVVLTLLVYGSVAAYAFFGWWLPHRRPMPPEKIAWVLEDSVPDFNEKLISAVEFSDQKDGRISMDMINEVLEDAKVDLSKVDPMNIFPLSAKSFAAPIVASLVFLTLLCTPSIQFGRLVT